MKLKYLSITTSLLLASISISSQAATTALPGYTQGATVMKVPETQGQIDSINDLVYEQIYSTRSVRAMHMSLLVPRNTNKKPAIVYFPGGGFTSDEYGKFIEMRMALAQAGYVVAAAEYRVIPDTFPAPVEDGKAAVRFLREHAAQYGIDPNRIGVLGDSAGGWLSQMLGTTNGDKSFDKGDFLDKSSDVQAVVTLYGISDLLKIGEGFPSNIQKVHRSSAATEALLVNGSAFGDFPGASIQDNKQKALEASPMGHIHGLKPPFLIMHGSADTLVSPQQSAELYRALKSEGNKADYILVEGAEHGDIHWYQPAVIAEVVSWFKQNLGLPTKGTSKAGANQNDNL